MLACVVSSSLYKSFMEDTIYTVKLRHQGIIIEQEMDVNRMKTIIVENIMITDIDTVFDSLPVLELSEKIINTGHMGFPVVTDLGGLIGIVTHSDFDKIEEMDHENLKVKDIMSQDLITVHPGDTLEDVLIKTEDEEISHFPVVDPQDPAKIIGFFTKGDIIRAYTKKRV